MVLTQQEERLLKNIYYDPKKGFTGAKALYEKVKERNQSISLKKVKLWLKNNDLQQTFKESKRAKKYPKIVGKIGYYQADLTFLDKYKRKNNGYSILLTCIDINSKEGYVVGLKNKFQNTIVEAFEEIKKEIENERNDTMKVLHTDNGKEFKNQSIRRWCRENDIEQKFSQEYDKRETSVVERFNKTLKMRIEKYLTFNNTNKWIDVIDDIVENYNNTIHNATGMKPFDVELADEIEFLRMKLIHNQEFKKSRKKIAVGDKIRLKREKKNDFDTRIGINWSKKVYEVREVGLNSVKVVGREKKYKIDEIQKVGRDNVDIDTGTRRREVRRKG
jgi:Fe2+ or Zn2+ uptake regulation protein